MDGTKTRKINVEAGNPAKLVEELAKAIMGFATGLDGLQDPTEEYSGSVRRTAEWFAAHPAHFLTRALTCLPADAQREFLTVAMLMADAEERARVGRFFRSNDYVRAQTEQLGVSMSALTHENTLPSRMRVRVEHAHGDERVEREMSFVALLTAYGMPALGTKVLDALDLEKGGELTIEARGIGTMTITRLSEPERPAEPAAAGDGAS